MFNVYLCNMIGQWLANLKLLCVYLFSIEAAINPFDDHRGSSLLKRAETSQDG